MQLLTIFPMLQYDFMRHAFLAAVLIAPLFALLGTMAVNNKMAFFSDALGLCWGCRSLCLRCLPSGFSLVW